MKLFSLAANTRSPEADAISNPFDEIQPRPQLMSRILGGSVLLRCKQDNTAPVQVIRNSYDDL